MTSFAQYRKMAKDPQLKDHEKVGRGDIYVGKQNKENQIFPDINRKLDIQANTTICDIGCGCSTPVKNLIQFAKKHHNQLTLIDSKEMLDQLPDDPFIQKVAGEFPLNLTLFLQERQQSFDYVITYSVLHVVFPDADMVAFLDTAVSLLKPRGKLLIGDIPNLNKKKRFLSSTYGIKFHQQWSGDISVPKVVWNEFEKGVLDESIVFMILQRYRNLGCETYLLPQPEGLPMNKTREDILIQKL